MPHLLWSRLLLSSLLILLLLLLLNLLLLLLLEMIPRQLLDMVLGRLLLLLLLHLLSWNVVHLRNVLHLLLGLLRYVDDRTPMDGHVLQLLLIRVLHDGVIGILHRTRTYIHLTVTN